MPTVTLVSSRTFREAQSPFISPSRDWPTNVRQIELRCNAPAFSDPANHVTFTIERSLDGGTVWDFVVSATFTGGLHPRRGTPIQPNITFQPDSAELLVSFKIRARMDVIGQITGPIVAAWDT